MKNLHPMLYILFLIYWCCSKPDDSRSNFKIENRDGLWYDKKINQLYTGSFSDTLTRYIEGSFKNGKRDGYWKHTHKKITKSYQRVCTKMVLNIQNGLDDGQTATYIDQWNMIMVYLLVNGMK